MHEQRQALPTRGRRKVGVPSRLIAATLIIGGILFLGAGLASAAAPQAIGTAERQPDNSITGVVTATGLPSPDGTSYDVLFELLVRGSGTTTAGAATIPFVIPADNVVTDCTLGLGLLRSNGTGAIILVDTPITNCGTNTSSPPKTTSPPTTTSSSTTTFSSTTSTSTSTSTMTSATTTPSTSTSAGTTPPTLTTTPAYIPGPGGTGDSSPDMSLIGLGVLLLLGAAGLIAGPKLRRGR